MILSAASLRRIRPVEPFIERTVTRGMSGGLSAAGYDVHVREDVYLHSGRRFSLASTVERFTMPDDVLAIVHDKSSWARRGLSVFNTVIEAGWTGFLTLELAFKADAESLRIHAGDPIAQIIFHQIDAPVVGYSGKYQDQPARPVPALEERA